MGLVDTHLELRNPRRPDLDALSVVALADTGSVFLCIPPSMSSALGLEPCGTKTLTLADGSKHRVPYVGPIEVRFKNRVGYTGAVVMGDEVLLGAIPMEDMDLVVIPRTRQVDVNPESPDIAGGRASDHAARMVTGMPLSTALPDNGSSSRSSARMLQLTPGRSRATDR